MSTPAIVRRFRKELRELEEIQPNSTVYLQQDTKRSANITAAKLLLQEAFHDRITIEVADHGFVCASREEAAIYRLQQYTIRQDVPTELLLKEIPVSDLQEYLSQHNESTEVFVPQSPEYDFVQTLADDFEDIIYGL